MNRSLISDHYITVDGNQLHYIKRIGKTSVTILFVHGRAMSTACWEKQFESEELADYTLLAVDLPGHGLSAHSGDITIFYSLKGFANTLIKFSKQLELTDYVLVGLSIGAHIALQALPQLEDCKGLFAMTMPFTKSIDLGALYQSVEVFSKVYIESPLKEDVAEYCKLLLAPDNQEIPTFIEESFYQSDPKMHEGILNGVIAGDYLDETDVINSIAVPVAIVVGNQDQIHDLSYLDTLDISVWRATCQIVGQAGHCLQWEQAEGVNQLLTAFAHDCKREALNLS